MGNSATDDSMQDAASRLEGMLFPEGDGGTPDEPVPNEGEVVSEDDVNLPDDGDTELEVEGEGSDDDGIVDEIDEDDDLTLAGYLGIEDDRIEQNEEGDWAFKAIIDGESKLVPLKELVSSYQLQGHVNNKSMAVEAERKQHQEQMEAQTKEIAQRIQGLDMLSKAAEQQLLSEFNGIDWDALRVSDPAEWAAQRQAFADRAQKISQIQTLVHQEGNRVLEEQQTKQQEQFNAHMQAEMQKVLENNPTWADQAVMQKELGTIRDFVTTTYGFTAEDMKYVTDHRLVKLIQDAQKYHSGNKAAQQKRDKPVPKFQKPGKRQANAEQLAKARSIKAKRAKVKETGSVRDAANLILDRI